MTSPSPHPPPDPANPPPGSPTPPPLRPKPFTAVLARYGEMAEVRRASLTLENHGIDGADIRLTGGGAERAVASTKRSGPGERTDRRLVRHVGTNVVRGVAVGIPVGALAGAVVGGVLVAVADFDSAGWVVAGVAAFGALIGGVLGAFIRFERTTGFDDTWQVMLAETAGPISLAVRVDDEDAAQRVLELLARHAPPTSYEVRDVRPDGAHIVEPRR